MKMISWNVNGIRAAVNKGFYDFFEDVDADIFCIQESKMQEGQLELLTPHHYQYFNSADRKGYSGTIVFSKIKPLSVAYDIEVDEHAHEGRVITLEYDSFYFVCVYTPNSGDGLKRLDYRDEWDQAFSAYVNRLKEKKSVIITGDLNVANEEIDIKNPSANRKNAGFTDTERNNFKALLSTGFIDSFRFLYPDEVKYSWWSYRFNARSRNAGWRIDYFLVSEDLRTHIKDATILNEVLGSDHCPICLEIEVK